MKDRSGVTEATYDWHDASHDVLTAMAFRCAEERHDARGAVDVGAIPPLLHVYKVCRWCGQEVR